MKKNIEYVDSLENINDSFIMIGGLLNRYKKGTIYIKENELITSDLLDKLYNKIEKSIIPTPFIVIKKKIINNNNYICIEFSGKDIPYLVNNKTYIRINNKDTLWKKKDVCKYYMIMNQNRNKDM